MDKGEELESYPIKSLHDFLSELDKEWGKFRTASIVGIITSGTLIVFLVFRFLSVLWRIRNLGLRFAEVLDELVFLVLITVFVSYEIHLLFRQHKFFARWERRVGLLIHLEERIMERLEEDAAKDGDVTCEADKK